MASNHVRRALETKTKNKAVLMTYEGRDSLLEVIRGLGHDPSLINTADLQGVADKLSNVARREIPWGWRYLRNVLNGKQMPSQVLNNAIMRLGAAIDGMHEDLVKSDRVMVQAVGTIKPGALVLASSRPCANPGCKIEFVPVVPWQKCHSRECSKRLRELRKGEK